MPPLSAALEAGATRIRPVLMTALAMIIGMIPMALGLGEGAEQNAPLGRAVIGGLLFATVSTLFFVPVVYAGVHQRLARAQGGARGHGRHAARINRSAVRIRRAEAMSEQRHSALGIHPIDPMTRSTGPSCSSGARSCAAPGS